MGFKILYDQWGGMVRSVESSPGDDREVVVTTTQDADRILRANSRDADVDQSGRHFRHVARVPMVIVQQAIREGWHRDKAKWRAWLNDPDNRAFRIWQGRV